MMLDATGSLLISVGTSYFAPSALSKIHGTPYLGRCPRLLHLAPLALGLGVFTRSLTRVVLTRSCQQKGRVPTCRDSPKKLVGMRGLEPPRCHHHRLLRPARLPVPPHPRAFE